MLIISKIVKNIKTELVTTAFKSGRPRKPSVNTDRIIRRISTPNPRNLAEQIHNKLIHDYQLTNDKIKFVRSQVGKRFESKVSMANSETEEVELWYGVVSPGPGQRHLFALIR